MTPTRIYGLITLSILSACTDPEQAVQGDPPPPEVTVAHPIEREIIEWDYFTGRTQAAKTVELRARVSGYLDAISFEPGHMVEKGDLLFVIDQRPYLAALGRTEAQLLRAEAELELAKNELKRAEDLVHSSAIAKQEYDRRAAETKIAEAGVQSAKASVQVARLDLDFTQIRAPFRGLISRQFVDEGNLIAGGDKDSTLLGFLVSVDPIYVYVDVDERSALKYARLHREGKRVSARYARIPVGVALSSDVGYPYQGVIDYVEPRADASTGTNVGRVVIDNPDGFLHGGFFARVRVPGSEKYQAILISDRAVIQDQGQKHVWLVDAENVVHYRRIETGPRYEGLRVIRSGLDGNDKIIVNGIHRGRDGVTVNAKMAEMAEFAASKTFDDT